MSFASGFGIFASGVAGLLVGYAIAWGLRHGHFGDEVVHQSWVPLTTAGLFAALPLLVPVGALPAYLWLAAAGVALAAVDLACRRLPNQLTLPTAGFVGVWLVGGSLLFGAPDQGWRTLGAGCAFVAFLGVTRALNPSGLGMGDVKLAWPLGFALGWVGWSELIAGAIFAFVLAAVVGVALVAAGRATRRTALPFGPFMLAGALLALMIGHDLVHWYHVGW